MPLLSQLLDLVVLTVLLLVLKVALELEPLVVALVLLSLLPGQLAVVVARRLRRPLVVAAVGLVVVVEEQ